MPAGLPLDAKRLPLGVSQGAVVLSGALLAVLVIVSAQSVEWGIDYGFYRDTGARFLEDGVWYLPHQLAGPYDVTLMVDNLYPPSAIALFVPAAVLPSILWWAIPIAVTGYAIHRFRPGPLAIAGMLLLLCWPRAHAAFLFGNTDMWGMAAVAAGLVWGWPAVLLLLKPTFAPLALLGVRHRSWWLALGGMAVFGLLTLPLWLDYLTAMTNVRASGDYSLGSLPLLMVPIVARLGRSRTA
jgi:hypothetical protein